MKLIDMKIFILVFLICPFTLTYSASGWSSSGGGEYIIDQHNPWFMGEKTVTYCIDHGGPTQFSLDEDNSKKEIERSLLRISSQIKSINKHYSHVQRGNFYTTGGNGWYSKYCGIDKIDKNSNWISHCEEFRKPGNALYLSDKFKFIKDCSSADLQIILGNYENKNIKKLYREIGLVKFSSLVGIAQRTHYSQKTLNGKGFIYIAADKGERQYLGARNVKFKNQTIWDSPYKYLLDIILPEEINDYLFYSLEFSNFSLKDQIVGNLESILTHELGHVFGFKHNNADNIMNIDYPATIVRNGLSFKYDYVSKSRIFSNSLIETNKNRTINYNFRSNYLRNDFWEEVGDDSKNIYNFLYNYPEIDSTNQDTPIIFSFQMKHQDDFSEDIEKELENAFLAPKNHTTKYKYSDNKLVSSLNLYSINKKNGKYKLLKNYIWEKIIPCQPPQTVDNISIRIKNLNPDNGWRFDQDSKTWVETSSKKEEEISNITILNLDNNYICGRILIPETKNFLEFKITHYYNRSFSEIIMKDPTTNFETILRMDQGDQFDGHRNLSHFKPFNYFYYDPLRSDN